MRNIACCSVIISNYPGIKALNTSQSIAPQLVLLFGFQLLSVKPLLQTCKTVLQFKVHGFKKNKNLR